MLQRTQLRSPYERGIFCLSFDFELAWGSFYNSSIEPLKRKARLTRERVFPQLLELLTRYQISATWATVGHLLLKSCDGNHGQPHPSPPSFPDWYCYDPKENEETSPEWYGHSLVQQLLSLYPEQDIGLHGFSHCVFNDPSCTTAVAKKEMQNALQAAQDLGLTPISFVFPRDGQGHFDVLLEAGIKVYRGSNQNWYFRLPAPLAKPLHMIHQFLGLAPPTVMPGIEHGLVKVPGSHLYLSMDGLRRFIPIRSRVRAADQALHQASHWKRIFHLYCHPINLAYEDSRTQSLLKGFEDILARAARLRDSRLLNILNMRQIAQQLTSF